MAKRIVDKNILRLIKLWLKAPVVGREGWEEEDRGEPEGDASRRRDIAAVRQYLSSCIGSDMESEKG